jgi:hypothetical protein
MIIAEDLPLHLDNDPHIETVCLLRSNHAGPKDYVETGVDAENYNRIKDSE